MPKDLETRVVAGRAHNEDAVVVNFPRGRNLVGHVDLIAPLVNDARAYGRIAAAHAFMAIYAMGALPWSSMSIACFPESLANEAPDLLRNVIEGALESMVEAGAVAAGGHTVKDDEMKFGLAVTGFVEEGKAASATNLKSGNVLLLTKPLGIGVLAMTVKDSLEGHEEAETAIARVAGRLDVHAARAISTFGIRAACAVSREGLAGHLLQMVGLSSQKSSQKSSQNTSLTLEIEAQSLPLMEGAAQYAAKGLYPQGSKENLERYGRNVSWRACSEGDDEARKRLFFDEQTSGGLVLGVAKEKANEVLGYLKDAGEDAHLIGRVVKGRGDKDAPVVVL